MAVSKRVRSVTLFTGAALAAGCAGPPAARPAQDPRPPGGPVPAQALAAQAAPGTLARELLPGMSVAEKVGQLFVPRVAATAAGIRQIRKYHAGGVIYFPANLATPRRAAALSNALQAGAQIPLLIGVDEETGTVSRAPFTTRFPGAMALGAAGDPALVRRAAGTTGAELKAVGINLNFAPVADVNSNPANPVIGTRSYSSDPGLVSQLIGPAIEGHRTAGVATVAKHFPGHGDTATDSHTGLPVIRHSAEQWARLDAPPFRAAIAAGVDAIMTAHVKVPKLDPSGVPATLSRPVLTGLLRGKLGFDGVIITDSLEMAGARVPGGAPEAAVRALLAGADQILMPPSLPQAYAAVAKAVRSGRIPAARLDEAVRRILALKERRGLFGATNAAPAAAVSTAAHRKTALEVATRAVTVVRNARSVLPLRGGVYVAGPQRATLAAALRKEGVRVTSPGRAKTYVITTTSASPTSTRYLKGLTRRRKVVSVVLGSPYSLRYTAPSHASVAAYASSGIALRGLARVLAGKAAATGRLPVTVPKGARLGTGIGVGIRT